MKKTTQLLPSSLRQVFRTAHGDQRTGEWREAEVLESDLRIRNHFHVDSWRCWFFLIWGISFDFRFSFTHHTQGVRVCWVDEAIHGVFVGFVKVSLCFSGASGLNFFADGGSVE